MSECERVRVWQGQDLLLIRHSAEGRNVDSDGVDAAKQSMVCWAATEVSSFQATRDTPEERALALGSEKRSNLFQTEQKRKGGGGII